MPIYEYQCSRCNDVFELLHRMDEDCKVVCPKCMAPAKKLISATSFVLKGSGFYVNDYPSKSRKDGKKAEKEPSDKVAPLKNEGNKAENAGKSDSRK
jgi:putative FmdB family regulatory protein